MLKFDFNSFTEHLRKSLTKKVLKTGEELFKEGNDVDFFYFCETGCIRLEVYPESSRPLVLYRARDGEAFAEEHLMLDQYSYSAIADLKTTVTMAPKALMRNYIQRNPGVASLYVQCVIRRYYNLRVNFERLGIKSAKGRVMHLLRTMSKQHGIAIDLTGKVKSLSSDLNLTHEAAYRALKELEDEGVLTRNDGIIHLHDNVEI